MASTSPHKSSVVVIVADSNAAQYAQPHSSYIKYLLECLSEGNNPHRHVYIVSVFYGFSGFPVSAIPVSVVGAQNELQKVPANCTILRGALATSALDGYVAAFEMIDNFRRSTENPKEGVSYHLWHITLGEKDYGRFDISPAIPDLTWETVPTELKKRNIILSMILIHRCQLFLELFTATSRRHINPWFPICPYHTILLPPFVFRPKLAVSPTVLTKRRAEVPAEHVSRRRKIVGSSWPAATLASVKAKQEIPPATLYPQPSKEASPTVLPVAVPGSPIQQSAYEMQPVMGNKCSVTLIWNCAGLDVYAPVQATDWIREKPFVWPRSLRLDIVDAGMYTLAIQASIHANKAPVVHIKCIEEMAKQYFDQLVKELRRNNYYAVARWETQDSNLPPPGLLLAPLNEGLLCAAFPSQADLPVRQKSPFQESRQEPQPQVDYPLSASIPFENGEFRQGDTSSDQTNVFVVQQMPPQQLQSHAYIQGQAPLWDAQQSEQPASLDTQHALSDGLSLDDCEFKATTENDAGVEFHQVGLQTGQLGASTDLYGGCVDGVGVSQGMEVLPWYDSEGIVNL